MTAPRNIVLVGFMGTGKTAVAQQLSERLDWALVDTDELIVQRAKKPITSIFLEDGEAHFRDLETEVIRGLDLRERCVIATGGGCVMRIDNIRALREAGMVVNLAARPDVILQRCQGDSGRPLLQVENPAAQVQELLRVRAPLYAMAHHTIDTSDLSVERVVQAIAALWPEGRLL